MGGSVAFREGCKSGVRFHDLLTCISWPYRSNVLLKELFGDVVLVTNLAVGGTNTAVGTTISKYDTLAGDTDQADIIITINAYVANDNLEQKEQDIFQIVPFSFIKGLKILFQQKRAAALRPFSLSSSSYSRLVMGPFFYYFHFSCQIPTTPSNDIGTNRTI